MNILTIGGGGREHAIITALSKSEHVNQLYCAPGNGGISLLAECFPEVKATDIDGIVALAKRLKPDIVFVAADDPLVLGAVDSLNAEGIRTFGPRANAAAIEGSKVFAKEFMRRHNIPTAKYAAFSSPSEAKAYLRGRDTYPIVIKCDGLAFGKGALIVTTEAEAFSVVDEVLCGGKFGDSGKNVVIEDYMQGVEATILVFTDGKTYKIMPPLSDHKRAFDGDKGLNTGGMGVIAPTPYVNAATLKQAEELIIKPTIDGLRDEGRPFKGVLYFELMVNPSDKNAVPRVIEYNCRFGDPECQTVLPLLQSDLAEIIAAVWDERLDSLEVKFSNKAAACVVAASGGYPEKYATEKLISGLDTIEGAALYHAGTRKTDDGFVTAGGRVLNIVAVADTLPLSLKKAYAEIKKVKFDDMFYRTDIGKKALS
ncbi:MAG: phosphoribosylamine--glycine ligase [Oscillospiraceae bacterium]|jgi:phosphoribosylamine--glycine ligase|nr:phosphoribosylamine--glycine ligase [Oscillospiraceae bacterium]